MSTAKVKFTVHVYDADLASYAKTNDIPEGDAGEEFAIVASEYVADALHAIYRAPRRLPRLSKGPTGDRPPTEAG